MPLLSTMVANSRCRSQLGGGSNEVMSLLFLSVSNVLVYTDMASCISWSSDFSPSATNWVFYKYLGPTVRNLSLRRTSLTWNSGSTVVCFLIASLRCCRKVRGFSLGCCCKAKLLFYIDTWHFGEKVSELFWASVSSLEEWRIWSKLNYFLPLWDGWNGINTIYTPHHFFWFSNVEELNPGLCTCWADTLSLSYVFIQFFFLWLYWTWTQDFMPLKQHFSAWAISAAPFGVDLSRGLLVPL
jgi:hypothetical protein